MFIPLSRDTRTANSVSHIFSWENSVPPIPIIPLFCYFIHSSLPLQCCNNRRRIFYVQQSKHLNIWLSAATTSAGSRFGNLDHTASEAASILHLSLRTVLNRAASGKLPSKIPDDIPFTYDGRQNYLIRLEGLPQKAQFEYLQNKLPTSQRCELDLATPRSSFGDAWLSSFLDVAQLIQSA